jgi:hypothetical protein
VALEEGEEARENSNFVLEQQATVSVLVVTQKKKMRNSSSLDCCCCCCFAGGCDDVAGAGSKQVCNHPLSFASSFVRADFRVFHVITTTVWRLTLFSLFV